MKSLITLIALLASVGGAMAQKTVLPEVKVRGSVQCQPHAITRALHGYIGHGTNGCNYYGNDLLQPQ